MQTTIKDLKPGDVFKAFPNGSLRLVTAVSDTFLTSYGEDNTHYKAQSKTVSVLTIFDYDVIYCDQNKLQYKPNRYDFTYPVDSIVYLVQPEITVDIDGYKVPVSESN